MSSFRTGGITKRDQRKPKLRRKSWALANFFAASGFPSFPHRIRWLTMIPAASPISVIIGPITLRLDA